MFIYTSSKCHMYILQIGLSRLRLLDHIIKVVSTCPASLTTNRLVSESIVDSIDYEEFLNVFESSLGTYQPINVAYKLSYFQANEVTRSLMSKHNNRQKYHMIASSPLRHQSACENDGLSHYLMPKQNGNVSISKVIVRAIITCDFRLS